MFWSSICHNSKNAPAIALSFMRTTVPFSLKLTIVSSSPQTSHSTGLSYCPEVIQVRFRFVCESISGLVGPPAWSGANNVRLDPAVVLGDEPGFRVEHNSLEIVTAERSPVAYVNEMIVLARMNRTA